ncbi:MAG: COX15/CtaA family protein [Acidobacteriota bacterium]|nr:COX15/CtaA family protein [Acidobacteriota bacterium]
MPRPDSTTAPHLHLFRRYAWGLLAYNVLVILWGAVVRASGSGNGCGEHWPLCGGVVIPHAAQIATMIEFAHRMTSGLAAILVILLVVLALRWLPAGHRGRHFAVAALVFTLIEGLIGAALVLFGDVGTNASMSRVVILSIHLVNTFLLLASLALTARAANQRAGSGSEPGAGPGFQAACGGGLVAVIAVAVTGTIAALADTLYHATSLAAGFQLDFSGASAPILRLRVLHPLLALLAAAYLLAVCVRLRASATIAPAARRRAGWLLSFVLAQVAAGVLDIVLLTPIWAQVVHLLVADLIWITLVLLSADVAGLGAGTLRGGAGDAPPAARPRV